ncbi:MAG: hypothetical protein GY710_26525 [Desulfobacteraceae bacterium]|nr:hypothetical protein [Desulfobacteraceae bacterium]
MEKTTFIAIYKNASETLEPGPYRFHAFTAPYQIAGYLTILREEFPEYWNRMIEMEKTIIGRPDQIIGFQGKTSFLEIDHKMAIDAGEIANKNEECCLFNL